MSVAHLLANRNRLVNLAENEIDESRGGCKQCERLFKEAIDELVKALEFLDDEIESKSEIIKNYEDMVIKHQGLIKRLQAELAAKEIEKDETQVIA